MSIRVVNLRGDSPCQAEPDEIVVVVNRTTPLGNPFYMKEHSMKEREKVIQQYRMHLNKEIIKGGEVQKELNKIVDLLDAGKKVALACSCAPLPCHGDIIKSAVEYILLQRFRIRSRFHKDGSLPQRESTIFVFGSNLRGRHGKGAALTAAQKFGAIEGQADGLMGRSFGIPTKDEFIQSIPFGFLDLYVGAFCAYAKLNPDKNFFVTRVGCGLAGNPDKDVAKLIRRIATDMQYDLKNCSFAEEWKTFMTE